MFPSAPARPIGTFLGPPSRLAHGTKTERLPLPLKATSHYFPEPIKLTHHPFYTAVLGSFLLTNSNPCRCLQLWLPKPAQVVIPCILRDEEREVLGGDQGSREQDKPLFLQREWRGCGGLGGGNGGIMPGRTALCSYQVTSGKSKHPWTPASPKICIQTQSFFFKLRLEADPAF